MNFEKISSENIFSKHHTLFLVVMLLFSLFIRLYDISETPLGMHADEVSGGYNAYSILRTGRDEHGKFLPLYFEAFNDYKHPFLIYSMVPSIALFDLTPSGTRFPSVFFSTFGIIFFYFTLKYLFDKNVALLGSFLLSVMPWYFHYSRLGFEVMSFCFLFLLGLFLFFKGFKNKRWWFVSVIAFSISLYAYGIARLFVPLFLLGMIWIYRDMLFPQHRKIVFSCIFLFILLTLPAYYASFFGEANARFAVVSVFNRSETPALSFFLNYFSHFSPSYLFFTGDAQIVNAVTHWGELYHFALIFLPLGLYYCWKNRKEKSAQLLLLWILLYPLPASFTYGDLPHSARSMIGVPALTALIALGIFFSYSLLERIERPLIFDKMRMSYSSLFVLLIIGVILIELFFFFHSYFFLYKHTSADHWLAFARPTVSYLEQIKPAFDHVYLSKTGLDLFYISFLYYIKADPALYHEQGLAAFGYEICDFERCFNESQKNVYVFRGFEVTINATHNINYHNSDKIAVKIFETQ